MIKNYLEHRRKNTQSSKQYAKSKPTFQQKVEKLQAILEKTQSKSLTLVKQSAKKATDKPTFFGQLNELQQSKQNSYFSFGQRFGVQKNWNLNLDKIAEVQDSGSKRNFTSHRSATSYRTNYNKQSFNSSNMQQKFRKPTKRKNNKHKSKQKYNKTRNEKSKSTLSLSKTKPNSKQIQFRTYKMEKSIKMLWECMGQLWQNNRVSQYKQEKNSENLKNLKRKLEEQEKKILQMKFQMSKTERHAKPHFGLKA